MAEFKYDGTTDLKGTFEYKMTITRKVEVDLDSVGYDTFNSLEEAVSWDVETYKQDPYDFLNCENDTDELTIEAKRVTE